MSDGKPLTEITRDGWQNLITGLGQSSRDKRLGAMPYAPILSYGELRELYRGDAMAARIVDRPADDMTRAGFDVAVDGEASDADKDATEAVETALDELEVCSRFNEALRFERAYGGAGILLGVNDGTDDLSKPLDENKIRSLDFLTVFDAQELHTLEYYNNPLAAKFGEPRLFRIVPRAFTGGALNILSDVHESRIIRFPGIKVARDQALFNQGHGDSVLVRCVDEVRDSGMSWHSASALIADFAQAVFKTPGLAEAIGSDQEGNILRRMQILDMTRAVGRGILLDKEEEFSREPTPLSGLPDLLEKLCLRLASVAGMPVSLLMGQSPAGLNATGASDIRFWYDEISSRQSNHLRRPLNRVVQIAFRAKAGPTKGREPENWQINFRPLWQLDALQQADLRLKNAQADAAQVNAGILMPEEVAESRHGGDTYGNEIKLDRELREELASVELNPPTPEEAESLRTPGAKSGAASTPASGKGSRGA